MEIRHANTQQGAPQGANLLDEALGIGSRAINAAENFVEHHKVASTVAAVAAAGSILALRKWGGLAAAGEIAEGALLNAGKDATGAAVSDGGLNLAHTLVRRSAVPLMSLPALALVGCTQEPQKEAHIYKNAGDCEKDVVFSKNYCDTKYLEAEQTHQQTSPKFENKKDCEDKTSLQCTADTTNQQNQGQPPVAHSTFFYWRPYLSGYMISRENSDPNDKSYAGRTSPLYSPSEATSEFVTSHGDLVSEKTGTTQVSEHTINEASRTGTTTGEGTSIEKATSSEGAFSKSETSVDAHGVSRGGFGGEEAGHGVAGEGAHVGGEAGGAHVSAHGVSVGE